MTWDYGKHIAAVVSVIVEIVSSSGATLALSDAKSSHSVSSTGTDIIYDDGNGH